MERGRIKVKWIALLVFAGVVFTLWILERRQPVDSRSLPTPSVASATQANSSFRTNLQMMNAISIVERVTATVEKVVRDAGAEWPSAVLAKFANDIHIADIPAALAAVKDLPTSRPQGELRQLLVRRWTKADAPTAAAWVERNFSGVARKAALNGVATAWAENDATSAENWARQLSESDERSGALLSIAGEVTRENPIAALSLAVELPQSQARDEFLARSAADWATADSKNAIEWGKKIEDAELRARLLGAIATASAGNDAAAAATLAAQSLPPGRAQDDAVVSIVQRWVQREPEQAGAWVTAFPQGKLRDTALDALVKIWADKDLTEAGKWVNTLPPGTGSDVAIAAYVEKIAVQFPEMAAEWANEIRDTKLRDARLENLAELWLQSDAPAARKWLAQSPLSEATKTRLLERAKQ
jgi:hypothetical protein